MADSLGVRQDLFMIGTDQQLWHAYDSGTALVDWTVFSPGKFTSASPAMYLPNGDIVIYARGLDQKCWRVHWHHDTGKVDVEQVFSGQLATAPMVCMPVQAGKDGAPGKDGLPGKDAPAIDTSQFAAKNHPHGAKTTIT